MARIFTLNDLMNAVGAEGNREASKYLAWLMNRASRTSAFCMPALPPDSRFIPTSNIGACTRTEFFKQ